MTLALTLLATLAFSLAALTTLLAALSGLLLLLTRLLLLPGMTTRALQLSSSSLRRGVSHSRCIDLVSAARPRPGSLGVLIV